MSVVPPDLTSLISLDGMHAYVERHFGAFAAKVAGGLFVLGIVSLAVLAIFTVGREGYQITTEIFQWGWPKVAGGEPLAQNLPSLDFDAWRAAPTAVGILAVFVLGWLLSIRIRNINRELKYLVGYLNDNVHQRLLDLRADLDRQREGLLAIEAYPDPKPRSHRTISDLTKRLPAPEVEINFARYGFEDRWADVTQEVRGQMRNNRAEFDVNNRILNCVGPRDPYKGQNKILEVTYSLDGIVQPVATAREKTRIKIPE
jgi:hypothetical protein